MFGSAHIYDVHVRGCPTPLAITRAYPERVKIAESRVGYAGNMCLVLLHLVPSLNVSIPFYCVRHG